MKLFWSYCRQQRRFVWIFLLFCTIFLCVFALYHLPLGAVLYPTALCALVLLCAFLAGFKKTRDRDKVLSRLAQLPAELIECLPKAETVEVAGYQTLVRHLCQTQKQMRGQMVENYANLVEYYTVWAHQIKTPIAAMRLLLQNEDTDLARKLSEEVLRVEQYVEMVLCYLRLDSDDTDYLIAQYDLDTIVRKALHRFAGQFIRRGVALDYQALNASVVTDEKWLLFVIEQVLSNALKYTPQGSVSVSLEQPKTLCIRDTGIGIAPEDLPRIFSRSYTGKNGRWEKRASGLGLYLCSRICRNLGHTISARSELGRGTEIRIGLEQTVPEAE